MARGETPTPERPARTHPRLMLITPAVVAAGALLARHADGTSALPTWVQIVLQMPALIAWCGWVGSRKRPGGLIHLLPSLCVLVGGAGIAFATGKIQVLFAAFTTFVCGALLIDGIHHLYRRVEGQILESTHLLRSLAGPWLGMILIATVLLSLPIATHSAVPDYRHNFWDHALNNAFAATSSACLVGTTVYSFGQEYALFGQVVLVLTTQLAGMGFAALGLAIVQPFMNSVIRLRTILLISFGLQILAVAATWGSWHGPDVTSGWDRLWWGVVHAGGALWNCGLTLRDDGLAAFVFDRAIFATITTLSMIGSLSLPIILDLIIGHRPTKKTARHSDQPTTGPPWRILPQCEAAFAFVLLIAGAAGLWFCETPWRPEIVWRLPDAWTPDRPVDFGTNQILMRDDMSYGARWTRAVLVSTTLRSAGIQSIPVSHGALSWPSYGLLLTWMFLGGSAGGVAGGMRTSGLLLAGICLFTRRRRWSSQPGGTAARSTILRASLLFVPLWLAVNAAAIGLLAVTSEGTPYELILDGNAACNSVGLSTGLSLHLTAAGRMVMIVTMTAGRFIPVWYWLTSTGKFSQRLRSREGADLCTT